MTKLKIYGASDDLVEVEGGVPGCDEYGAYDAPLYVELSTGDVFKVEYAERGVWLVTHQVESGKVAAAKTPHGEGDDPEPHTEAVEVVGPVEWAEAWEVWPPAPADVREKLGEILADEPDDFDRGRFLDDADVVAMWQIVAAARRRGSWKGR